MIYENDLIYIEKEEAQVPWIKILPSKFIKNLAIAPMNFKKKF